ncbi:lipopolysaccharide biosynthesis protein [Capnocytophaga cynodegmi]|uniref:lipopolysaccharide biosynthesis protein n=1 Tax=Capnocytophaga cynodegmi TaxID=28189 RepID=UPI00385F64D1
MSSKLRLGLLWSIIEVVIKRALDFVVKLILARLLFPEDFGVIGMATVFISFIQVLNDGGMGPAIIQKRNLTQEHLNTVFWTNVFWSLFLYSLLSFGVAPFVSNFYNQPILSKIIPFLSLSILTSALNTVHFALLRRDLKFKQIAIIRNVSSLIGGCYAVYLALFDFGIWALVANEIVACVVSVPLFYNKSRWIPKLQWNSKILKEVVSFGVFVTGTKVIMNIVSNIDYLIIGKWIGAAALGYYTLAFMMTNLVSGQITSMLDTVMFPFYSTIQNDINKLKTYYLKLIGYYALLIYPIMLTLILFAEDLINLFFGEKWGEVVLPLRVLALAVMINVLTSGYNLLFRSTGNPKHEFKIQQITSLVVYLPCILIGVYLYGVVGAVTGILLSKIINIFVHLHVLNKYFKIQSFEIFKQVYKIVVLCLVTSVVVLLLRLVRIDNQLIFVVYVLTLSISYIKIFKNNLMILLKK